MPPRKHDANDLFDDESDDDELDALDEEADDLDDEELDLFDDDELVGRLPPDEPYNADDDESIFVDPDDGLPPDQARSRRALLGVPELDDDEDNAPYSPTREMQHALIKLVNPENEERFNQRHRVSVYSYRVLSRAEFWLEWDKVVPPELTDVKETIEAGQHALRHAYFGGEEHDLQEARAIQSRARSRRRSIGVDVVPRAAVC
jgi:hypothetical protein